MNRWRLSKRAAGDFTEIYAYGFNTMGKRAADDYAANLRACFALLALNPRMGRMAIAGSSAETRRFEHRRHVIYYDVEPDGVRVLAIVHERSVRGIDD